MTAMSREESRRFDRQAIEALGVSGLVLMENAGRGATDAIQDFLGGSVRGKRIAVVAGAGNNGGDGFVVARHLSLRGAGVATFLLAEPAGFTGDAAANLEIIRRLGQDIRDFSGGVDALAGELESFDLVVDAIGGTGVTGALHGLPAQAVEQLNASGRRVVAIDIPTGLDCDTGLAAGPAVRAALTVTFVATKNGFSTKGTERYTGRVVVADIGVPPPER